VLFDAFGEEAATAVAGDADVEELVQGQPLPDAHDNRVTADLAHKCRGAVVDLAAQVLQDRSDGEEPLEHRDVDLLADFLDPGGVVALVPAQ
jgi:hypothetical protein